MAKRKKKKTLDGISLFAVAAVILTLSVVTWVKGQQLQAQIDVYDAKIAEYEAMIAEEDERTEELEERKKYVQTKKYIEEVAKEKYGLLYENEILLKPVKK